MKTAEILSQSLLAILETARLAPSVHNTQPWLVHQHKDQLTITIDARHALTHGDPTGRQTMISLGIFCEALDLAAAAYGLRLFKTTINVDTVAATFTNLASVGTSAATSLLEQRSSDRSIYQPAVISTEMRHKLEKTGSSQARVWVSTERSLIDMVAKLTSNAIGVALSSQGFRDELSQYLVLPGSNKQRGIGVKSLYINNLIARLQPITLRRGINLGAEAKLEKQRWESASGLVFITAKGDMPKFWLEVGRSYLRASLAIESLGLSQATSAGIVEASNYHEDIEAALHTDERVLAIIRIGKGSDVRHYSPRVNATDLLH